jgi:hypothetical protein
MQVDKNHKENKEGKFLNFIRFGMFTHRQVFTFQADCNISNLPYHCTVLPFSITKKGLLAAKKLYLLYCIVPVHSNLQN